jgi:CRISPR/Cas system CMR-associated protein Cmr3 (group 5 of RAMP superfamily)
MTRPDRSIHARTFVRNDLERLGFKQHNLKRKVGHRIFYRFSTDNTFLFVANTNTNDVVIDWNDQIIHIGSREQWVRFRDEKLLSPGSSANPIVLDD